MAPMQLTPDAPWFLSLLRDQGESSLRSMLGYAEILKHGMCGELKPDQQARINDILREGHDAYDFWLHMADYIQLLSTQPTFETHHVTVAVSYGYRRHPQREYPRNPVAEKALPWRGNSITYGSLVRCDAWLLDLTQIHLAHPYELSFLPEKAQASSRVISQVSDASLGFAFYTYHDPPLSRERIEQLRKTPGTSYFIGFRAIELQETQFTIEVNDHVVRVYFELPFAGVADPGPDGVAPWDADYW